MRSVVCADDEVSTCDTGVLKLVLLCHSVTVPLSYPLRTGDPLVRQRFHKCIVYGLTLK